MKKLILLLLPICLLSCKSDKIIQDNNFYHTSYGNEECYAGGKTFSQIILCQQANSNKEIAQNRITNELLKDEK